MVNQEMVVILYTILTERVLKQYGILRKLDKKQRAGAWGFTMKCISNALKGKKRKIRSDVMRKYIERGVDKSILEDIIRAVKSYEESGEFKLVKEYIRKINSMLKEHNVIAPMWTIYYNFISTIIKKCRIMRDPARIQMVKAYISFYKDTYYADEELLKEIAMYTLEVIDKLV